MTSENTGINRICDHDFEFVGPILPMRDEKGEILEYTHNLPAGILPNRFAVGPFCTLNPVPVRLGPGVYAITICDNPVYVGESENLSRRFGPENYGYISGRNCHSDGQSTNCRVNSQLLQEFKKGNPVGLWFFGTPNRKNIEAEIISKIRPSWNNRTNTINKADLKSEFIRGTVQNIQAFRKALVDEFRRGTENGKTSIVILALDLHRKVGYDPKNHRMPMCCDAMWSVFREGEDRILYSPLKKRGSRLRIEYTLPRPVV